MPFDINEFDYGAKAASLSSALTVRHAKTPSHFYRDMGKRALDLALVFLTLPISLPLIVLMAVLVAMDGGNPFYTQARIGRGGRKFRMLKLRTMVPNADAQLKRYLEANPAAKAEWNTTQKLKRDPRVTFVGRMLRKCSLDELPQLLNVVTGSMSLVGPRPMMVQQKELYTGAGYYELRPGLTGLWQISKRNEGDFADRVAFDEVYNRTLSLSTDLGVILNTVRVVLRCTGY